MAFPGLFLELVFPFFGALVDYYDEEGRVCTVLLHVIRKSQTPSEKRLAARHFLIL